MQTPSPNFEMHPTYMLKDPVSMSTLLVDWRDELKPTISYLKEMFHNPGTKQPQIEFSVKHN